MLRRQELLGINYQELSAEELEIKLNKALMDWKACKKKAIDNKEE